MTVHTPAQARLLLDLHYAAVLGEVMAQAASAGAVAARTRMDLKQVHHRLVRLREVGLVYICAEQKRSGRAVKVYRASAESFIVPFGLTDAATLEELMKQLYRPFNAALARHQAATLKHEQHDVRLRLDEARQLNYDLGERPALSDKIRPYGTASSLSMSSEDAASLLSECIRLSRWASEHHDPEGESYLLGLMFTPGQMEP